MPVSSAPANFQQFLTQQSIQYTIKNHNGNHPAELLQSIGYEDDTIHHDRCILKQIHPSDNCKKLHLTSYCTVFATISDTQFPYSTTQKWEQPPYHTGSRSHASTTLSHLPAPAGT